jgi:starch-binding outer membrane protein, SusD/RagB family
MFKSTSLKLTIVTVLVSICFSCNKWLDLKPQDGITGAEFWKTKEQVQSAVMGCYAALLASPTSGTRPLAEYAFLWGELRADMVSATTGTTSDENDVISVNILPANGISNWRTVYQVINYCNTVIDNGPKVLSVDATFTQDALKKYIAEAKTIRALMYFYLVRTFGDVPLKLKSSSSDQDIEPIAKSTADEVLTQILKDLSEAEPDAVVSFGDKASDKGRVTVYLVNALQADVNLWMGKYNECVSACNKVINSNRFGLIDGSSQDVWYNTLYGVGNSNEGIFELQFDKQASNSFYDLLQSPRRHLIANPAVLDELYTVDPVDPVNNKDIRADGGSVRSTDGIVWKYAGWNTTTARASTESYAHWIVYRYADILLMKAEALNETGNGQGALDLITQVRNRARALPATNTSPAASDRIGVEDFILQERAREFAYEGKRWFDLLRFAKRNNYERLNLLLDVVSKTVPPDRQQSAIAKIKDKNSHYLPIYSYELQTDKLLIQNPFYK